VSACDLPDGPFYCGLVELNLLINGFCPKGRVVNQEFERLYPLDLKGWESGKVYF